MPFYGNFFLLNFILWLAFIIYSATVPKICLCYLLATFFVICITYSVDF